jgi:hypothetical protein
MPSVHHPFDNQLSVASADDRASLRGTHIFSAASVAAGAVSAWNEMTLEQSCSCRANARLVLRCSADVDPRGPQRPSDVPFSCGLQAKCVQSAGGPFVSPRSQNQLIQWDRAKIDLQYPSLPDYGGRQLTYSRPTPLVVLNLTMPFGSFVT